MLCRASVRQADGCPSRASSVALGRGRDAVDRQVGAVEFGLAIQTQADGRLQEFHVAFVYAPKRDDKGRVTGVVAIVIDITARKKAEQEREKLLAHLTEVDRQPGGVAVFDFGFKNQTESLGVALQWSQPDEQAKKYSSGLFDHFP